MESEKKRWKFMKSSEKKNIQKRKEAFGANEDQNTKKTDPKQQNKFKFSSKKTKMSKSKNQKGQIRTKKHNRDQPVKYESQKRAEKVKIQQKRLTLNKEYSQMRDLKKSSEEYSKVTGKSFEAIKDDLPRLSRSPDSSRIVQYLIKQSDAEIKNQIFEILKPHISDLFLDIHGVFVVEKMMKYLDKDRVNQIFEIVESNILSYCAKKKPAKVIDACYKKVFTNEQKQKILYKFFGPNFALEYKTGSTMQVIFSDEQKKQQSLEYAFKHLQRLMKPGVIKATFVHDIFVHFFKYCCKAKEQHLCHDLQPYIVYLSSSQSGALCASYTIKNANAKEQKIMVRLLDEFGMYNLFKSPSAYIVICSLLNYVSLEGLLKNRVIKCINENIEDFIEDKFAYRVILCALTCSGSLIGIPPDTIDKMKLIDHNFSAEMNKDIKLSLINHMAKKIATFLVSNTSKLLDKKVLQNLLLNFLPASGKYCKPLVKAIFDSMSHQFNLVSFWDSGDSHFFIKSFLSKDSFANNNAISLEEDDCNDKFADLLCKYFIENDLSGICSSNRGMFSLIHILKSASPASIKLLKEKLILKKDLIESKDFKACSVLKTYCT